MSQSIPYTPTTTAYSATPSAIPEIPAESSRKGSVSSNSGESNFHAINLANYVFNAGYASSQWADVQLVFYNQDVKLHRLILARSPFLQRAMMSYAPGSTIHLSFPDDNISPESVHVVLHHLYAPAHHLVNPSNARSVLAAAYFFEGMPELVHHAYTICRGAISQETVLDVVHWLNAQPTSNGYSNGTMFGSVAIQNGLATAPSSQSSEMWKGEENGRYGEWSSRLKQDVLEYLIRTLPESLVSVGPLTSNPTLLSIYTSLPYELFKHVLEHPSLPITPTQTRFTFAKKVIALRKKSALAAGMEESVVLAIASDQGAVHITRRPKRARTALWKVEG